MNRADKTTDHELNSNETHFDQLSPTTQVRVNQLCDQFEQLWQSNSCPELDAFVLGLADTELLCAIRELVDIDVEYRKRSRLLIDIDSYLARFPMLEREWLESRIDSPVLVASLPVAEPKSLSGLKQLGDYTILDELGAGGMGQVYRAEHRLMGRQVAIKILKDSRSRDTTSRLRFQREVQTLARLSHPNIVIAYDAREEQGVLYLVTELVDGEDLANLVRHKGPLKPVDAMYFAWQAAKGLKYAHDQGIVHRDVKPSNLILQRKRLVKVLDLGLAMLRDAEHQTGSNKPAITNTHIVGTAAFMSPEQARAPNTVDKRSDIYSLGCTLYYLIVGQPPFVRGSDFETIMAHIHSPIPTFSTVADHSHKIPARLVALVRKMLDKAPEKRPESMDEVIIELSGLLKSERSETKHFLNSVLNNVSQVFTRNLSTMQRYWVPAAVSTCALLILSTLWTLLSDGDRANDSNELPASQFESANHSPVLRPSVPERTPIPAAQPEPNLPRTAPNWQGGLSFDGFRSFVRIPIPNRQVESTFSIEAAVIARPQAKPANIVTFSGDRCLVIFVTNSVWGVAYFDGQNRRLIVSESYIRYGQPTLVAGRLQSGELSLHLNGSKAATMEIDYPMQPGPHELYLGGIPTGVIPAEQGTRYFSGVIAAVRIQSGNLLPPARTIDEMRLIDSSTIAMFPLNENSGEICRDASPQRLRGEIVDATWRPPNVEQRWRQ